MKKQELPDLVNLLVLGNKLFTITSHRRRIGAVNLDPAFVMNVVRNSMAAAR